MSIDQLDLILCDMYKIDIYMPPYFKRREEFEKASYSIWAIDELISPIDCIREEVGVLMNSLNTRMISSNWYLDILKSHPLVS